MVVSISWLSVQQQQVCGARFVGGELSRPSPKITLTCYRCGYYISTGELPPLSKKGRMPSDLSLAWRFYNTPLPTCRLKKSAAIFVRLSLSEHEARGAYAG